MRPEFYRDEVESILDAVLGSHDRLIRREIDASTCQTKSDWKALHEAQDRHAEARDTAVTALTQLILNAEKGR